MATRQQEKRPVPDMTIYVTDEQRELMDQLFIDLDKLGIDMRDNRGNPSYSRLIRLALADLNTDVQAKLKREGKGGNDGLRN